MQSQLKDYVLPTVVGAKQDGEAQQWTGPQTSGSNFPTEPLAPPLDLADYGGNKSVPSVCFLFCWEEKFDVFSERKISPSGANLAPN